MAATGRMATWFVGPRAQNAGPLFIDQDFQNHTAEPSTTCRAHLSTGPLVTAQATSPWSWPGTQLPVESDQAHPWAVGQGHWPELGLPEKIALRVYVSLRSLRKKDQIQKRSCWHHRWREVKVEQHSKKVEDASELFRNLYHQKHLLGLSPESEFPKSQQWKGEGGKN